MKVICVNIDDWKSNKAIVFTIGKIYDVFKNDFYYRYSIIDDNGNEWVYYEDWFKPLSEYRNEKIDKLLENESSMYR